MHSFFSTSCIYPILLFFCGQTRSEGSDSPRCEIVNVNDVRCDLLQRRKQLRGEWFHARTHVLLAAFLYSCILFFFFLGDIVIPQSALDLWGWAWAGSLFL